jgi:hypothetical protein
VVGAMGPGASVPRPFSYALSVSSSRLVHLSYEPPRKSCYLELVEQALEMELPFRAVVADIL